MKTSPLFEFPPNPVAITKWYAGAWLPVTEFGIYLLLAGTRDDANHPSNKTS